MKWCHVIWLVIFCSVLAGCFPKKVKYLGCTWRIPEEMSEVSKGKFSYASIDQDFYSIDFSGKPYEKPDPKLYTFLAKFKDQTLEVRKYKAHSTYDQKLDSYIVSRANYESEVFVFNEDYKRFLVKCD